MKASGLASALLLSAFLLIAPSFSQAAPPPGSTQAQVIFSNGGRILSMNADGTDREVLFGKNRPSSNDRMGAVDPEVSPDGNTIVFNFRRGDTEKPVNDVWRMKADGTSAKRLFRTTGPDRYLDPSFAPNGRIVMTYVGVRGRVVTSGLISVNGNGGERKFLTKTRERKAVLGTWRVPTESAVSPDGKRVLYLSTHTSRRGYYDEYFGSRLGVLTLKTGRTDWINGEAYGAEWSPEGRRIVFSTITYNGGSEDFYSEVCWWELGCEMASRLVVANADGENRRPLTPRKFDARNPDWSNDGRIVFQANRSMGETGEANEIHSILADGSCFTALTNGTPASVSPVWNSANGTRTRPSGCGSAPPGPNVEIETPDASKLSPGSYWLGKRHGRYLLSLTNDSNWYSSFYYFDCAVQKPGACRQPAIVFTVDVCYLRTELAESFGAMKAVRRQRGLPVFRFPVTEYGPEILFVTGRSISYVIGGSGGGRQQAIAEVEALRLYGEKHAAGALPPARFPSFDIRLMKKSKRVYEATESVPVAARRLGISRVRLRDNLKLSRSISQFGDYGTIKCPRWSSETDSSSDSSSSSLGLRSIQGT